MGLNDTPLGERIHIGLFGRTNAGKSSLLNGISNQPIAIVSNQRGTTTDPVYKSMELLPLGPVVLMDTPGLDDESELGKQRIQKSFQLMNKTDIGLLVVEAGKQLSEIEMDLVHRFEKKKIPFYIVVNKVDQMNATQKEEMETCLRSIHAEDICFVSATNEADMDRFRNLIAKHSFDNHQGRVLVRDLFLPNERVVLVVPIDKAAPKGRLILPQQQTIRDILDGDGIVEIVKEDQLQTVIQNHGESIRLVITDSQVFEMVNKIVPKEIPLTSFSILFSRFKGEFEQQMEGAKQLDQLKDGSRILISEGCSHHRQCGDIGTQKLPTWIAKYTNKNCVFEYTNGTHFPETLSSYDLVIHCGACMLNEREIKYRLACAMDEGVPMTNYGIAIAHMNGILERTTAVFKKI